MTNKTTYMKATALLFLLPAIAVAEGRTLIYGNVSGWTVHTDPAKGFSCFAEALYEGESVLRVGFESDSLYLHVADSAWARTDISDNTEVAVWFDEVDSVDFESWSMPQDSAVSISIAADQEQDFLRDFASGYTISVSLDDGEPVMLSLGGSLNATRMLQECQTSMQEFAVD